MRKFISAAAGLAAMTVSLLGATPASAAALTPVTVTCTGSALVLSANNLTAAANDTIDITNSTGVQIDSYNTSYAQVVSVPSPWANNAVGNFKVLRSGSASIQMTAAASGACASQSVTLSFNTGGGSSSSSSPSSQAPRPEVQEFGMPASGVCEDGVVAANVDWNGKTWIGGWRQIWAQWVNDGTGGFVCSRTLVYNTATSSWVVS